MDEVKLSAQSQLDTDSLESLSEVSNEEGTSKRIENGSLEGKEEARKIEISDEERFDEYDKKLRRKSKKRFLSNIDLLIPPKKSFNTDKKGSRRSSFSVLKRSNSFTPHSKRLEELINTLKDSEKKDGIFNDDEKLRLTLKSLKCNVLQRIITNAFRTSRYKKFIKNEKMLKSLDIKGNTGSEKEIKVDSGIVELNLQRHSSKQVKDSTDFDCGYFSMALFLSCIEGDKPLFSKLVDFLKVNKKNLKESYKNMTRLQKQENIYYTNPCFKPKKAQLTLNVLLTKQPFMLHLVKSILFYGEEHVYRRFLDYLIENKMSWNYLIEEKIIRNFFEFNKMEELKVLIKLFLYSIYHGNEIARREFLNLNVDIETKIKEQRMTLSLSGPNDSTTRGRIVPFNLRSKSAKHLLNEDSEEKKQKMRFEAILDLIVKNLIQTSSIFKREEEVINYILEFSTVEIDHLRIFELMLSLKNEDIMFNFTKKNQKYLYDRIRKSELIEKRMFKVLLLFSPFELAKCLEIDNNFRKILIFDVTPESADEINSITLILTHIKKSFWNIKRFWQFYQQVCEFLEFQADNSPFVFCSNPLLLAIRLYNLLKNLNIRLNVNAKEINTVSNELQKFIIEMIEITDHRELRVYIIEEDLLGNNFLDYVFKANATEISMQNYVQQMIDNMWDQRRLSKHGIFNFLMIHELDVKSIQKVGDILKLKPVQNVAYSSSFMYTFTSTSHFLRVIMSVVTNISMACVEFWFTMMASQYYDDDDAWGILSESYNYAPRVTIFFTILRVFYMTNLSVKMITLKIKIKSLNFLDYSILVSYILQIGVFPWLNGTDLRRKLEYFWIQFQVLIFILLVMKAGLLSLSIPWMGVQLRIGITMFLTVLAFTVVSFIIILVLAFIFFTWFRDYDDPAGANRFFSIYNGILILFEFLFGSVLYLREEPINFYSVSQNVILVTFSYLGNIMMANILIAFLTNQYENISKNASYLTKRMQYTLLVAYKTDSFDSIFLMPIFMNFLYIVALPLMCFQKWRAQTNEVMKKIAHTVAVAIPVTVIISLYSILKMPVLYLKLLKHFLFNILKRPQEFFLFFIFGVFIIVILWIKDTLMLCKLLFSYKKANIERFWKQRLSDGTIGLYEKCYSSFKAICRKLINEKVYKATLNEMIYHHKFQTTQKETGSGFLDDIDNIQKMLHKGKNKQNYLMETKKTKFDLDFDEHKVFFNICKQFLSISEINGCRSLVKSSIDLQLSLRILEVKEKIAPTINIISFVLFEVQSSRIAATFDDDADLKGEIKYLQAEISEVKQMLGKLMKR